MGDAALPALAAEERRPEVRQIVDEIRRGT
jgi:hypothetical protein